MEIVEKNIKDFYRNTWIKISKTLYCKLSDVPYEYLRHKDRYGRDKCREYNKRLSDLNLFTFIKKWQR